jgi:uncharacterized membrane protein HdeD (DUF308 family)
VQITGFEGFLSRLEGAALAEPARRGSIWWIFLLQGIAGIILGLMLITAPGATLLVIVTFLGFYWLITGILALVRIFVDRSIPWNWSLLSGIVGILAGLLVLRHPVPSAEATCPSTFFEDATVLR